MMPSKPPNSIVNLGPSKTKDFLYPRKIAPNAVRRNVKSQTRNAPTTILLFARTASLHAALDLLLGLILSGVYCGPDVLPKKPKSSKSEERNGCRVPFVGRL